MKVAARNELSLHSSCNFMSRARSLLETQFDPSYAMHSVKLIVDRFRSKT
jgi:hypothetical protein